MESVLPFLIFSVKLCISMEYNTLPPPELKRVTHYEPSVIRKTCLLTPDHGPCRANIEMFYYNPSEKSCKTFIWGGCMGNGNRFDTSNQCNVSCLSQPYTRAKKIPKFCGLRFDYGYCFGQVQRYYYDAFWRVCKEAIYSGCGGNKNNFYNFEQCDQICRFGNGPLKYTRRTTAGVRKVIIINPRTTTSNPNASITTTNCMDTTNPTIVTNTEIAVTNPSQ